MMTIMTRVTLVLAIALAAGCATTRTAITIEPDAEPVQVERPINGPDHDLLNSGR